MHMNVFVFDQSTSVTEMTLFRGQLKKGGGEHQVFSSYEGEQKILKPA